MKKQQIIAIIFDFDETLVPDSTSSFLESAGIDALQFWKRHQGLVRKGWDCIPAYLQMIIEESEGRAEGERISREQLISAGKKLKPYPGVSRIFGRLKKQAQAVDSQIQVEFYIISSGIGEIIRASSIAGAFSDIWASDFAYNARGEIIFLKNVVSFTDKTRFLFQIAKGLTGPRSRANPYAVNEKVAAEKLRIPFEQMIVIGDGLTDVPCFSLVQQQGGVAIGVYDREVRERWGKAWGFIKSQRVTHMVAADYRKHSGLDDALCMAIDKVAANMLLRKVSPPF